MPDTSPILALPYLQANQSQKHVTHNDALRRLDILVQLVVEGFDATTPPALPAEGMTWALGTGATGVWAGQDGMLAAWMDAVWVFIPPQEGWRAYGRSDGMLRLLTAGGWSQPSPDLQNLDQVGIGTSSDASNRLAVASAATLLSHAGNGHQLKLNKATAADTGSLLFQTGWSGRAEMGLAGEDAFSIKVSPDGTTWETPLRLRSDGTTELGDIDCSGGIALGGTAPENRLGLYQVGSYVPSLIDMSGNAVSLGPKEISYVRIGAHVSILFNFLSNVDTTGLVAGDDVAVSLPFTASKYSFSSVNLNGSVAEPGPYHWQATPGTAHARIRSLTTNNRLSVSDLSSGETDIVGGTLTLIVAT